MEYVTSQDLDDTRCSTTDSLSLYIYILFFVYILYIYIYFFFCEIDICGFQNENKQKYLSVYISSVWCKSTNIYIYAQTGTFADPTVRRFELFFPFEAGVRFFREISRSIFFLRFQPIKCIRLKSIWRANRTCSCGTSNTILFKCCQHGVKYVPKQSIP